MHSSMDKPHQQPRPYCKTHQKSFRNWKAAYAHKATHSGCELYTTIVNTR